MQVSAEIRYFWRDTAPTGLQEWFRSSDDHPCPAGGGARRRDDYLRDPTQTELSLKRRGNGSGIEVKGLVAVSAASLPEPFTGKVEIWAKWTSSPLQLRPDAVTAIEKTRWLRKIDTGSATPTEIPLDAAEHPIATYVLPENGCNVEFTSLHLRDASSWWTLGLEAFGTVWGVERNLRLAAELLVARHAPPLSPEIIASYPSWLAKHAI